MRISDSRTADSHIVAYNFDGKLYFDVHDKSQCDTLKHPDCHEHPDTHPDRDAKPDEHAIADIDADCKLADAGTF